jgi:hypothetical protein
MTPLTTLPALLLLTLFPFLADHIVPAEEKKPPRTFGAEYVTYNPTQTLIYQTTFGETQANVLRKGGITYVTNEADRFRYNQELIVDGEGVRIRQVYQKLKILSFITKENTVTYDRPLLRIPFPLVEGKSWSWKGMEYFDGEKYRLEVEGKVVGTERITVPAGTFDAVKIETNMKSASGSANRIQEWYAQNIGMIRTRVTIQGGGVIGMVRDLLGYGEILFELKKIQPRKN